MGSINDYEWVLADSLTDVRSWYDLPPEQDPARAKCTIFESRFCSNLLFSLRLLSENRFTLFGRRSREEFYPLFLLQFVVMGFLFTAGKKSSFHK